MPRKPVIESNKQLAEYLESSEEIFCVITKEVLEGVIQDSAATYNETCRIIAESNQKYSKSLDLLTETIKESLDRRERSSTASSTALLGLDELIGAMKNPTINTPPPEINIESQLKIRKDITSKLVRATRLGTYYEEHIAGDPAFVRHEFRTKVNTHLRSCSMTKQPLLKINQEKDLLKNDLSHDFALLSMATRKSDAFIITEPGCFSVR